VRGKKSILSNLTSQVLLAIVAVILVGHFFPSFANSAKLISEIFINLIRMVVAPIIFHTMVLGNAGVGSLKRLGCVGGKAHLIFRNCNDPGIGHWVGCGPCSAAR